MLFGAVATNRCRDRRRVLCVLCVCVCVCVGKKLLIEMFEAKTQLEPLFRSDAPGTTLILIEEKTQNARRQLQERVAWFGLWKWFL